MTTPPDPTARTRADDACPGALSLHQAADGPLARVRLPGGVLTPAQLAALASAADELASGDLELTSRGNVQLRAVRDPDALAQRLADAGLLPSETHERVRNILASPLAGRVGSGPDVAGIVTDLDLGLRADPDLADLPGRVLFAVDDGTGDVTGLGPDIGVHALGGGEALDGEFALVLAGADTGVRVAADATVATMLAAARAFGRERDRQWRLAELRDGVAAVLDHTGLAATTDPVELGSEGSAPVGWFEQADGGVALGAVLAHGILPARTATVIAAVEKPVIVTPWRSIVLVDLTEDEAEAVVRVLAPMGLIFDANSPWAQVSSCVGSPGCAKSHADVRADLEFAVGAGTAGRDGREHWVGCDRACGSPHSEHLRVTATGEGYDGERVDGPRLS